MNDDLAPAVRVSTWARWKRRLASLLVATLVFSYPAPWLARYLALQRSYRDPVDVDDFYQTAAVSIAIVSGVVAWLVMAWADRRRRLSR